jgi:hypothetical protein
MRAQPDPRGHAEARYDLWRPQIAPLQADPPLHSLKMNDILKGENKNLASAEEWDETLHQAYPFHEGANANWKCDEIIGARLGPLSASNGGMNRMLSKKNNELICRVAPKTPMGKAILYFRVLATTDSGGIEP